ncbi:Hypothetical protein CINCED_3A021380 [Cinara cedri]|uniref:THAP-type domain-containing protein n=1 Tax=Cinara cedri TaxID=506608 RepID=A0A5E4NPA6_9HEMI|nr:Hypothetical protein CINCED_3A021380 [Cinara cedri]
MVLLCCVKNCRNSKISTKEKKCKMFRITNNAISCKQWLSNCGRLDLCDRPIESLYNNYRICVNHFKDNMFSHSDKNRLLPSAVPTVFDKGANMSPKLLSNEEEKNEMRRNIILHRRKVVSFLENVYNVSLKPIVQSHPFELLELDMFVKNKVQNSNSCTTKEVDEEEEVVEEYPVKQEIIETDSLNDCESDVSVGSTEPWNGICQTPNFETDEYSNRRSSRILINVNSKHHRKYNKLKSDCSDDSEVIDSKKKQSKILTQHELNKLRFKKPLLRKEHNAKERLCRSIIAKSFIELSKCCSYLDTKRRVPSKYSILVAAKRECDSLKLYEKKLLVEKEYWKTANEQLKRRLKAGSVPSDVILIDD